MRYLIFLFLLLWAGLVSKCIPSTIEHVKSEIKNSQNEQQKIKGD